MKYLNILLIALIIILIVGGAWFFFFNKPSIPTESTQTTTQTSTPTEQPVVSKGFEPEAFTATFYRWYLTNSAFHLGFLISPEFKQVRTDWLTPQFITTIDGASLDTDPLSLSQDYFNDWAPNVTTRTVSQSAADATILVTLGGTHPTTVSAHLSKTTNGWRIDSVTR